MEAFPLGSGGSAPQIFNSRSSECPFKLLNDVNNESMFRSVLNPVVIQTRDIPFHPIPS